MQSLDLHMATKGYASLIITLPLFKDKCVWHIFLVPFDSNFKLTEFLLASFFLDALILLAGIGSTVDVSEKQQQQHQQRNIDNFFSLREKKGTNLLGKT